MRLEARAKVNLGLSVLGRRADGFHELDTVFARLELHDLLELAPRASGVKMRVTGAALPDGPANLAHRAAAAYLAASGGSGGVDLRLTKRVPIAAGLGGGSSDAAAVLRGLRALYPAELDLLALAASLGSDVPFFALDVPAARGQGRGERLTLLALPRLELVLVNPGVHVSAREAYAALEVFTPPLELPTLLERLAAGEEPNYTNALEPGVLARYPAVGAVLAALRAEGLRGVMMSGSGSSCFGLADSAHAALRSAARLQAAHPGWWVRATATA